MVQAIVQCGLKGQQLPASISKDLMSVMLVFVFHKIQTHEVKLLVITQKFE